MASTSSAAVCGFLLDINISQAFCVAVVADLTVSVLPFLKAAVLQDSYVATVLPYWRKYASCKERTALH